MDEGFLRNAEAIRRLFGSLGVSADDLEEHNKASVSAVGPTYPEGVVAYADGVIIQKESKYPPLKTIGGNADEQRRDE